MNSTPVALALFVVISMYKTHHGKHFHVASGTFTVLYTHQHHPSPEFFHHPTETETIKQLHTPPAPSPWQSLVHCLYEFVCFRAS